MKINIKKFNNWKISTKIVSLLVVINFFFFLVMFFYILPVVKDKLYDEKRSALRDEVETAYSVINSFYSKIKTEGLTEDVAQSMAAQAVGSLRYKGNEYFFVHNLNCINLVHINPKLVGQSQAELKDPNGKKFAMEMVEVCKRDKKGYVDYYWLKQGAENPSPKISYVQLFEPWGWVLGSGIYVDDVEKEISSLQVKILFITFITIILAIVIGYYFSRIITKQISGIIAKFNEVFELKSDPNEINEKGEIGYLASFISKIADSQHNLAVDLFSQTNLLIDASKRLLENSEQSSEFSEKLLAQLSTLAASSEEVSSNTNSVATSSEEMSSSIKEIAKNTSVASTITQEATVKANSANDVMNRLGISSQEIGAIIKTITSIAEQTNLLALNATIEAARAGELGKGFAVVANEVKELAKESAKATEDITGKIKSIQDDSNGAIDAIKEIIGITKSINDISNTIASAIEEQSATTNEINRNISETVKGVLSIAESNSQVTSSAKEYSRLAQQVKDSSVELQQFADNLQKRIKSNFKL